MLYVYFGNGYIQQPGAGADFGFLLLADNSFLLLADNCKIILVGV